jgi:hypothetical protein
MHTAIQDPERSIASIECEQLTGPRDRCPLYTGFRKIRLTLESWDSVSRKPNSVCAYITPSSIGTWLGNPNQLRDISCFAISCVLRSSNNCPYNCGKGAGCSFRDGCRLWGKVAYKTLLGKTFRKEFHLLICGTEKIIYVLLWQLLTYKVHSTSRFSLSLFFNFKTSTRISFVR